MRGTCRAGAWIDASAVLEEAAGGAASKIAAFAFIKGFVEPPSGFARKKLAWELRRKFSHIRRIGVVRRGTHLKRTRVVLAGTGNTLGIA